MRDIVSFGHNVNCNCEHCQVNKETEIDEYRK